MRLQYTALLEQGDEHHETNADTDGDRLGMQNRGAKL